LSLKEVWDVARTLASRLTTVTGSRPVDVVSGQRMWLYVATTGATTQMVRRRVAEATQRNGTSVAHTTGSSSRHTVTTTKASSVKPEVARHRVAPSHRELSSGISPTWQRALSPSPRIVLRAQKPSDYVRWVDFSNADVHRDEETQCAKTWSEQTCCLSSSR
jgi:hypothetical protein